MSEDEKLRFKGVYLDEIAFAVDTNNVETLRQGMHADALNIASKFEDVISAMKSFVDSYPEAFKINGQPMVKEPNNINSIMLLNHASLMSLACWLLVKSYIANIDINAPAKNALLHAFFGSFLSQSIKSSDAGALRAMHDWMERETDVFSGIVGGIPVFGLLGELKASYNEALASFHEQAEKTQ